MSLENALVLLRQKDIICKTDENVAGRSSFKIGGSIALAVFPDSEEKLICALSVLEDERIRYEVIGNASNLLFAFDRFDGAFVFTSGVCGVRIEGERIVASCGASLTYLAELAAKNSLSGLEFAYGIPGLVGGSVFLNAGAYGSQISDVLEASLAYDTKSGTVKRITEHGFGYRKSVYMTDKSLICLGGEFALKKGDASEIRRKMKENMSARKEKQPLESPNAGSYFKRPEDAFAGKLIEDCGLKGLRVGGAEVSVKHAGFILNRENATAADVLLLEEKIKEKVMSRYGIALEREVRLIK